MKNITWGMIGCGNVTEVKSGPGLYKSNGSVLKGVYDRSEERAQDYAKRHNLECAYSSVEEMLNDKDIDIIYIATPPVTHKQYACDVINAGKIPYIEKPVALSYEDALEIEKLAKEKNTPLYVAYYRRALEKHLKMKEILDSKELGDVRYVRVLHDMIVEDSELDRNRLPWRLNVDVSGGGKFFDMAVHVIDYLQMFFGNLVKLEGIARNLGDYYDVDDTVSAYFEFESGVVGSGMWCYVADKNQDVVEIICDKGRIVTSGLGNESFEVHTKDKVTKYEFDAPENIAMPYQQSVVNELLGRGKCNCNFEQAILPLKMIDKLLVDVRKNGGEK